MSQLPSPAPRVSVIIPTYKHRDTILQTIDSVFAQTYTDYEIIVINDGSPDDTSQVLEELVSQGKINYIEQPNAGQAAARNRGLAQATGEFIAFLDDDDLWPPDKLEWQIEFLRVSSDAVMVGGGVQIIDERGEEVGSALTPRHAVTFETLFGGSPFFSPGQVLIRAAALREVGGLDAELWGTDDYDLWFRLSAHGPIAALPRLALYYRTHPANASKDTSKMFTNTLKTFEIQLQRVAPRKRRWLARRFHRWLYDYLGCQALVKLRTQKRAAFPGVWREVPQLLYFIGPMMKDRVLLQRLLYLLTPNALQPALRWLSKKVRF